MLASMKASKRGQITFPSLLQIFISFIVFLLISPMLDPYISAYVATIDQTTPEGQLNAAMAHLITFFILLGLIATIFNQATPRREGYYGPA